MYAGKKNKSQSFKCLQIENMSSSLVIGGAGGAVVSVVALHPSGSGFNPSRPEDFLRRKILDHAFLRKGSKAVGPGTCVDASDKDRVQVESSPWRRWLGSYEARNRPTENKL